MRTYTRTRKLTGIFLIVVCLSLFGSLRICAEEAPLYIKSGSWQETMRTTRANYQAWRAAHLQANVAFGPWHGTEPVAAATFDETAFPEQGVDLNARSAADKRLWLRRNELVDGVPNPLTCPDKSAVYLARLIQADAPVTFQAGFGSDDGIKVWLNGTLLLSRDVPRITAPDQDIVDLPLQAGDNQLLVRIYNIAGGCGFYFAPAGDPAAGIWNQMKTDFPVETAMMERDLRKASPLAWFIVPDAAELQRDMIRQAMSMEADQDTALRRELESLSSVSGDAPQWLDLYVRSCAALGALSSLKTLNLEALRRAITHLSEAYPDTYTAAPTYLARLDEFEKQLPAIREGLAAADAGALEAVNQLRTLQRAALLANPLLDFDRVLVIRRSEGNLGLPQNWQGNCSLPRRGYDNELLLLSPFADNKPPTRLFKPERDYLVGDVDIHFNGDRMLFSMLGSHDRWQIWEMASDGTGLRQVTPGVEPDVDNYDACYLPDGRIIFDSTRCFQGIPCVGGSDAVANLYIMNADGTGIRQLCFDQDHNWCPTVLNNGRILYSRWEYSDTPHYFSRLLFHMNPDGTNQVEFYGSNSFWPNSMFYTRPIPNHPSKVVTIVSGHHGVPRMGELVILDPAKGRKEADGVVQRIPGYGQPVEPVIVDQLVQEVWPKFLHPYPLSEHFFLVSCKPTPERPWGLYLVDSFDNMLLLHEEPGYAIFEPVPFRAQPAPQSIPDRVNLAKKDATVYLMDVYQGNGLRNVPRGTVKSLRLFSFHYGYQRIGGHQHIGMEGPWDVHRILGTVPVSDDGSAYFSVPANTPIAVQPLDSEGKALQVMRSWFTAMPGEVLSCVGCHEPQNTAPPSQFTLAARRTPDAIAPWYGKARGFSFIHEVQPVLDRHCAGCHGAADSANGRPDFTSYPERGPGNFNKPYLALHPYVRRPGPESDYHLQKPLEWHADTSELIQLLAKGHHGVQLDREGWDRLITWIDLNVPDHGRWSDHTELPDNGYARRAEMRAQYSCLLEDTSEEELTPAAYPRDYLAPETPVLIANAPEVQAWPFDAEEAARRQKTAGEEIRRTVDLGEGISMEFTLIPPGEFIMGGNGFADELPLTAVTIDTPFWLGVTEVTNAQYARFDPEYDSGYIDQHNKDHTTRGYPANLPDQPVIRVTWDEARAFTQWLTQQSGMSCSLPTEAQWEWACRAGSAEAMGYGTLNDDFSSLANLADLSVRRLAVAGINPQPIPNPSPFEDFLPKEARFDDGERLMCDVGRYAANAWGLKDMHGNVCEWTLSTYRPYPYTDKDGRNEINAGEKRVVRGGSWSDRPVRARSAFRLAYPPWQGVFNVGFRVIIPAEAIRENLAAQ